MAGAKTHTELIAWQLCDRLRRLVLRYTRTGPAAKEHDYRRQLRKSVRSACYNTSEGFYRFRHGDFGHSLVIAYGSLGEALDQLNEGLEEQYFTAEQHLEMKRLCLRAMKANIALRTSWKKRDSDAPARRPTSRPRHANKRARNNPPHA